MNSILVIGCIFFTFFVSQVIFSETGDNYCQPVKRCNPYSGSDRCMDRKTCAAYYQDCGKKPAPPNNSHLPQYLVIGDSIARGMFPFLKRRLEGIVEAHINPGTPETAADGARCIKVWVGPNLDRWDVISFNFGLNDSIKTTESDRANYGFNIRDILVYLMKTKAGKKGKLISILTTPTANTSCCPNTTEPWNFPCPYSIRSYNYAISNELKYFHPPVIIDDLFTEVNLVCCHRQDCFFDNCDLYLNSTTCPTKFTPQGLDFLARNVSLTVRLVLMREYM